MHMNVRLAYHQQHSEFVMKALKDYINNQLETKHVEPNDYLGAAIRYMLKQWNELTQFLRVPGAPLDNNQIENAIRPFAIGRKNWLFNGSPKGVKARVIFYSLIDTCKAINVEPYKYFCAMLHHIRLC